MMVKKVRTISDSQNTLFIHKAHRNIKRIAELLTNIMILCAPYNQKNTVCTRAFKRIDLSTVSFDFSI